MTTLDQPKGFDPPKDFDNPDHAVATGMTLAYLTLNDISVVPILDGDNNFTTDLLIQFPPMFEDAVQLEIRVRVLWEPGT